MGKKTIALDVEGTLADIHRIYVNEYNAKHRTKFTSKDINAFDMGTFPASKKDFIRDTELIWKERWEQIPPTEIDLSWKLSKLSINYEIDNLTNRGERSREILN